MDPRKDGSKVEFQYDFNKVVKQTNKQTEIRVQRRIARATMGAKTAETASKQTYKKMSMLNTTAATSSTRLIPNVTTAKLEVARKSRKSRKGTTKTPKRAAAMSNALRSTVKSKSEELTSESWTLLSSKRQSLTLSTVIFIIISLLKPAIG